MGRVKGLGPTTRLVTACNYEIWCCIKKCIAKAPSSLVLGKGVHREQFFSPITAKIFEIFCLAKSECANVALDNRMLKVERTRTRTWCGFG